MKKSTKWIGLTILLFALTSIVACDRNSKTIRAQKKKLINEFAKSIDLLPEEALANSEQLIEYLDDELKTLVPLMPIPQNEAESLINRLVNDPIRQLRPKKINGLFGDFSEIYNCVNDISKNYTAYQDLSMFTFFLGYIRIDMNHARKYVKELKKEIPRTWYDKYLAQYGTEEKIAKKVFYNKQSVLCHVSYKDKLLKDMHFQRPNGSYIRTIFNVGRLCPPKCPPEYYPK